MSQTLTKFFQAAVGVWLRKCFGTAVAEDVRERCYRFQEEANELTQSLGLTREEAHTLVDYTWDRPIGEPTQELGGVMVTLAALCYATDMDMGKSGEVELARIEQPEVTERIRQKQKTKPHQSALPGVASIEQPVYAQHPDIVGYARTKDLAPLLDENQPDGSYITIGLDHRVCWAEEPPYEHLEPLYRNPQPPTYIETSRHSKRLVEQQRARIAELERPFNLAEMQHALQEANVRGLVVMTSNQLGDFARELAKLRAPVEQAPRQG